VTGTTRVFENTADLRNEIVNARVYGGMHYRFSGEAGATLGEKVADYVDANYFRRIRWSGRAAHEEEDDDDDDSDND